MTQDVVAAAHPNPLVPMTNDRLELGEGARWVDGALYLVDMLTGRLLRRDEGSPARLLPVFELPQLLGAVAPIRGRPRSWMAATGTGIAVIGPDGGCEWLGRPEDGSPVPARMNDATVDPAGRFWSGSTAVDGSPGAGSLYQVQADGAVRRVLDGLSIPNGPAFNAGGDLMYLADSAVGTIERFTVDVASGDLLSREAFVRIDQPGHFPDGMTVDVEGALWVAVWGGSAVHRYLPDGRLDRTVAVPATQPTSVCIGGPSRRQLFVTSATVGLHSVNEMDGAVFTTTIDVEGVGLPEVLLT